MCCSTAAAEHWLARLEFEWGFLKRTYSYQGTFMLL